MTKPVLFNASLINEILKCDTPVELRRQRDRLFKEIDASFRGISALHYSKHELYTALLDWAQHLELLPTEAALMDLISCELEERAQILVKTRETDRAWAETLEVAFTHVVEAQKIYAHAVAEYHDHRIHSTLVEMANAAALHRPRRQMAYA